MSTFVVPIGSDFADGVTALPTQPYGSGGTPHVVGTPLPTADIFLYGNIASGALEEPPGSPKLERAEQCTCEHTLILPNYQDAIAYWAQMPRGLIVSDSNANVWRILSCDVTRQEAVKGALHYVMESISFDTPPDDFDLSEVSLDLNIIKHPRYAWALSPYVSDSSTFTTVGDTNIFYTDIKESIIRMIQNYTDSPFYPSAAAVQGLIQSNILSMLSPAIGASPTTMNLQINYPNQNFNGSVTPANPVPWDGTNANIPTANCPFFVINVPVDLTNVSDPITIAIAAAKELISKLWRGEDTPYIPSYEIIWTQKFFQPVYLNPGAYLEDPRDWVPDYFMVPGAASVIPRGNQADVGPVGPPSGNNSDTVAAGGSGNPSIFDFMTTINPQLFATNGLSGGQLAISSLRKSDRYGYDRTFFPITHKWLVSCIGRWDSQLYTNADRPQVASDYNALPSSFG